MSIKDAIALLIIVTIANIIGNLIVAKIVADQAQQQASTSPLGRLLGAL